jgi:hypothetical protein
MASRPYYYDKMKCISGSQRLQKTQKLQKKIEREGKENMYL